MVRSSRRPSFWACLVVNRARRHRALLASSLSTALSLACGEAQDINLGGRSISVGPEGGQGGENSGGLGSQSGSGGADPPPSGGAQGVPECSAEVVPEDRLQILSTAVGFGRNTKGGAEGCVVTVSSPDDRGPGTLREALESDVTAWIRFSVNLITLESDINVASNKTLDGGGGDVIIKNYGLRIGSGVENVLIYGVEFQGTETLGGAHSETGDPSDDAVLVEAGARDVWLDHNNFSGYADGLIDVIGGATDITVSFNHFRNHRRVMLIGNENGGAEDANIRVTLHHNWFEMTESYHPRLRRGWVHSYNNHFQAWESFGSGSSEAGQLLSENNVYEAGPDLAATLTEFSGDSEPGLLRSVDDVAINGGVLVERLPEMVFNASDFYDYELEPAGSELIATIESEAGTR